MKDNQTLGILGSGVRDGLQLKPVRYEWAYRLYNQAVANTWFPNEVQLVQDLADFKKRNSRHTKGFFISWNTTRATSDMKRCCVKTTSQQPTLGSLL